MTKFNTNPAQVFQQLQTLIKIIKDFCGQITEEQIRHNIFLIYEIIEEMFDFGISQLSDSTQLVQHVSTQPVQAKNITIPKTSIWNKNTIKVNATLDSILNYKKRNCVFIDIIESLVLLQSSSNAVLQKEIRGTVMMKSYLSGVPQLTLNLSPIRNLESRSFSELVDDSNFEFKNQLRLQPPLGELCIMDYRVTKDIDAPFQVYPFLTQESKFKVELLIKIQHDNPESVKAKFVNVKFRVPNNTSSAKPVITEDEY